MNARDKRLLIIRRIIESNNISSQDDLLQKLQQSAISITQSTLSRDLKVLNVAKLPHPDNGYVYIMPESIVADNSSSQRSTDIADNIVEVDFSGNLCVIKTRAGYANAVTVLIDNLAFPSVLGTVAGDDTIILVLREGVARAEVVGSLRQVCRTIDNVLADNQI